MGLTPDWIIEVHAIPSHAFDVSIPAKACLSCRQVYSFDKMLRRPLHLMFSSWSVQHPSSPLSRVCLIHVPTL